MAAYRAQIAHFRNALSELLSRATYPYTALGEGALTGSPSEMGLHCVLVAFSIAGHRRCRLNSLPDAVNARCDRYSDSRGPYIAETERYAPEQAIYHRSAGADAFSTAGR